MGILWKALLIFIFVFLAVFVSAFIYALIKIKKGKFIPKDKNKKEKK